MPTQEEVFQGPNGTGRCLGRGRRRSQPEATLVGDLGAESIDFLDIVFRLEKAFDIKIPRGELFPEDILTNAEYVQERQGHARRPGPVAASGCRLPISTRFRANPVVKDFGNLLTVQDMCRYVETKVGVDALRPSHDAVARP